MAKTKAKTITKFKAKNKKKLSTKKVLSKTAKKTLNKATQKSTKKSTKKSINKSTKKIAKKLNTKKAETIKTIAKKTIQKVIKKLDIDYSKAITPLGDRLVIRQTLNEKMTAGGLYIPDSVDSQMTYLKGEVLAAGHGSKNKKGHPKPLDVKVGDLVLFSSYASTKVVFNEEDLHIVSESEILGITQ